MPGQKSYGPAGKWIHDRAHKIMDKRKSDLQDRHGEQEGKSIAYAIATQQAHKVKKSPKGFRTKAGVRTAKSKHSNPLKEYRKTAMIGNIKLAAFFDELEKIKQAGLLGKSLKLLKPKKSIGQIAAESVGQHKALKAAKPRLMSRVQSQYGSARKAA